MSDIRINWQANFKDAYGNINSGSAMTVLLKKSDFDKVDLANFAGSETLGACRVGNRTRKSTVATFYSCQ